ncbi:MAG: hypothetical protein EON92_13250 [Burkholderiales bacterium]|nr:MAG: hypothetical protein EON92_13250 [Burkholderiales bacterium]
MFEDAGFQGVSIAAFVNRYRIAYWLRLAPLPMPLKSGLIRMLEAVGLGNAKLGANVGNLFTAGFKHG